jgi:hypothetical protein
MPQSSYSELKKNEKIVDIENKMVYKYVMVKVKGEDK